MGQAMAGSMNAGGAAAAAEKFCTSCGKPMARAAKFCPECGKAQ
jgi:predicted RNA-binding Zn-ribbon protein involved in translation (DUF1610 family)